MAEVISTEATPRPWVVVDEGSRIVIEGAERTLLVAEIDTSYDGPFSREGCEADAALIVRAVNAHETLVQALRDLRTGRTYPSVAAAAEAARTDPTGRERRAWEVAIIDAALEASNHEEPSRCPRCEGYEATYHTFEGECSESANSQARSEQP